VNMLCKARVVEKGPSAAWKRAWYCGRSHSREGVKAADATIASERHENEDVFC
jgi:hypothetical protein